MYVGMNYINGSFCPHRPDFESWNPSNEEPVGIFPMSNYGDVAEAVQAARHAFFSWRELSRVVRAEYFDRLCEVLKAKKDYVVKAISLETGKSVNESLAEVNEALHMAQYTFGMGRMPFGECVASEIAAKDSYVIRKPKGVVAVVSPWNFPFAIGGFWCAAPALLEGNTVVFKPSEDTPMVGQIIAELYEEAGFPPGVFNLVHGNGGVGDMLVNSKIDHICFTGSAAVGQYIRQVCANSWHKTCSCELGSKSAVMVFADADLDLALAGCVASAYKLSGQRCVSSGRLLVESSVYNEFVSKFVDLSSKITVGDPFSDPVPFMGPLINAAQRGRVEKFNQAASQNDFVQVLLKGQRAGDKGYFLTPHIYTCGWLSKDKMGVDDFLRDEVFGPHVAIIPFDGVEEAIGIFNDTEYGLSLGVCTSDFKKARLVRDKCDFGLGYWNGGSIAAESHLPFGGVKKSGNGLPSAAGTFRAVTHEVTWTVNHGPLAFPQGLQ